MSIHNAPTSITNRLFSADLALDIGGPLEGASVEVRAFIEAEAYEGPSLIIAWVVAAEDGAEHLLPATRDAVLKVDLEAARVTVQDWLFDVEEAR